MCELMCINVVEKKWNRGDSDKNRLLYLLILSSVDDFIAWRRKIKPRQNRLKNEVFCCVRGIPAYIYSSCRK